MGQDDEAFPFPCEIGPLVGVSTAICKVTVVLSPQPPSPQSRTRTPVPYIEVCHLGELSAPLRIGVNIESGGKPAIWHSLFHMLCFDHRLMCHDAPFRLKNWVSNID